MATTPRPPSLVPPTNSYWYYFAHAETDTFRGRYAAILAPYSIDPVKADAPVDVTRLIYAAAQEVVPTLFLQWHQGERGRGVQIALLHSVSN